MDHVDARRQAEAAASCRASTRQLLGIIACALLDIAGTLERNGRRLERVERLLEHAEPRNGPMREGDCA